MASRKMWCLSWNTEKLETLWFEQLFNVDPFESVISSRPNNLSHEQNLSTLTLSEGSTFSGKPGMHPSSDSRSCCSIVHVPADTQINGLTWFQTQKSVCGRGFVTKGCQNILPDSNKLNLHYNLTLPYPSSSCQVWQHNMQEPAARCRKKNL